MEGRQAEGELGGGKGGSVSGDVVPTQLSPELLSCHSSSKGRDTGGLLAMRRQRGDEGRGSFFLYEARGIIPLIRALS